MNIYRGIGLSLMISGIPAAIFIFLLTKNTPFTALFVGISILGASMFLTPEEESWVSKDLSLMLYSEFSNIASLLETFRISSFNKFVAYGEKVYLFLSEGSLEKAPDGPPNFLISVLDGKTVLSLESPINREIIEGNTSFCSAADFVLVEKLNVADKIECAEGNDIYSVKVYGTLIKDPLRTAKAFGGFYGLILGSIASILKGEASVVSFDESKNYKIIKVSIKR
ncbi:MAG: hypothetical protein ACPLSP_00090 [Fervidicoccus fontis]